MSDAQGDLPADVRSFLPRPAEPVEEYATRLRGLHRDLTLILEAVERGLATAAQPEEPEAEPDEAAASHSAEPAGRSGPIEVVAVPAHTEAPAAVAYELARTGAPRVEVLPPPTGEGRRAEPELREPQGAHALEAAGPPRPSHFPARPSDGRADAEAREPEWVEYAPLQPGPAPQGERFTPPTFPAAPPPARLTVPGSFLAVMVAGWLTVVGLLVALLVT